MRSFIILGFLAAVASAGVLPDYKYGPGVSGVRQEILVGGSGASGSLIEQGSSYNNAFGGSYSGLANSGSELISSTGSDSIGSGGYGNLGSSNIASGNYKQSGAAGTIFKIGIDALDSVPQTVHYSKQFYHYDAPEEFHAEGKIQKQLSNVLKKNLQVVFIKAPENNAATNAALQLAKQAIEQRTAIYVLTKQNDANQLVGQLQQIQENVQTTPEVRFVKYRTPEDVQRAKAQIKSQYDYFGGASETYNGGVAPVLNYASAGKPSKIIIGGPNKSSGSIYGSGSGSNYKSYSSNSALSFESGSNNSSEAESTQLIELGNLDSSSNATNSSYISSSSYLPPNLLKK